MHYPNFAVSPNPKEPFVPDSMLKDWCDKADKIGDPELRARIVQGSEALNRFDRGLLKKELSFVRNNSPYSNNYNVSYDNATLRNREGKRVLLGRGALKEELRAAVAYRDAYWDALESMREACRTVNQKLRAQAASAVEVAPVEPATIPAAKASPAKEADTKNSVASQLEALFPRRQSILSRKAVKPFETLRMGEESNPTGLATQLYALAARPIRKNEDAATQWSARLKELKALARQVETGTVPAATVKLATPEADRIAAQALDRLLTLNKGSGEAQQLARVQMFLKAARADGKASQTELHAKDEASIQRSINFMATSFGSSIAKYSVSYRGRGIETHREPAPPFIEASGIYATIDGLVRSDKSDASKWHSLERLAHEVADASYDRYSGQQHITPSRLNDVMRQILNQCAASTLPASTRVALLCEALDQFRPAAEYANRYWLENPAPTPRLPDAASQPSAAAKSSEPAKHRPYVYTYAPGFEPKWYEKPGADKKIVGSMLAAGALAVAGAAATHPDNARSMLGLPVASAPMDDERYTSTENPNDYVRQLNTQMLAREAERERRFDERMRRSADIPPYIPEPLPSDAFVPSYADPLPLEDRWQEPDTTTADIEARADRVARAEPLPGDISEDVQEMQRQAAEPPKEQGAYRFTARLVPPAVSHTGTLEASEPSLPGTPSR